MSSGASDEPRDLPDPFLRKIAHDIVGPVGVASGALKELERALGDAHAAQAPMMSLARRSLQRLERLAKRLRLAALIRSEALELETASLALQEIVAAAVAHASSLDGRKNVTLEVRSAPEACEVRGDRELLTFAVGELVSNALRFARKRARVSISVEGGFAVVDVEDDGPGFPPDLAASLAPGATPPPPESGIALPIVAALASRAGGRLRLEVGTLTQPADGRTGACARVELPLLAQ